MANDIDITPEEINFDELLDRYFRNQLSENEEKALMEDLQNNPEARAKAVATARMIQQMKEVQDEHDRPVLDALRSADNDMIERVVKKSTETNEKHTSRKAHLTWMLSIAASIVILFVIGFQYHDYSVVTGLGEEYSNIEISSSEIRGDEDQQVVKELNTLFTNAKNGEDLDATSARLAELWKQATSDNVNDYTDYAQEIGWWLSISYLKENEKDKAQEILTSLSTLDEGSDYLKNKAKEILSKLK